MKEIYYSECLKKYFDTKEECLKAEEEYNAKHAAEIKAKEERKAKAKEVDEAYKKYLTLRNKFIKEYGSYHCTFTEKDLPSGNIPDIFNKIFDWYW